MRRANLYESYADSHLDHSLLLLTKVYNNKLFACQSTIPFAVRMSVQSNSTISQAPTPGAYESKETLIGNFSSLTFSVCVWASN